MIPVMIVPILTGFVESWYQGDTIRAVVVDCKF